MDLSLELPDINYDAIKKIFILIVIGYVLYKFKKNIEKRKKRDEFTDMNSNKLLYKIFPVDTNYYLDNSKYDGIIYRDYLNLPVFKCSIDYDLSPTILSPISKIGQQPITYHDQIIKYMRHNIYPVNLHKTDPDAILDDLQNGNIDIGIINEELMRRYITNEDNYTLDKKKLNFSAIGGLYYMDFYLIGQPGNTLDRLSNIQSRITINTVNRNGEPILLEKLIKSYQFNVSDAVQIVINNNIEEMINKFMRDEIQYMFIICHPLDKYILDITETKKIRLIHLKDHYEDQTPASNSRPILDVGSRRDPNQYIRKRNIIPEDNMELSGNTIIQKENHLSILKRYIPRIYDKVIDLNYFHETDNEYSYLETYSIKYLMVARNNLDNKNIDILTNNLINHMEIMRDKLVKNNYIIGYFNHNDYDLKIDEMLVFDKNINLHEGCKKAYEKIGLIKYSENISCYVE